MLSATKAKPYSFFSFAQQRAAASASSKRPKTAEPVPVITAPSAPPSSSSPLIWRMLRLFFSQDPGTDIAVKILTFPLTGVMIYGMFETILFTQCADDRANTDFRELFFFLLAGIVLAYSYELAPRNRRKK